MDAVDIVRLDKTAIGRKPKILFWDIETSPLLGWAWQSYETDILKIEEDIKIISVAWRWYGEKKTHVKALPDFPKYKKGVVNDFYLVHHIWDLLHEADVVIAQNGDKFDTRIAQARMLAHGIEPPSPTIQIDTLKMARRYFNLPQYNLDNLLRYVGLPGKISTGGKDLWFRCLDGDRKAWDTMKEYNKNDVEILPALYEKMRGWHKTHPILTHLTRQHMACPVCLSQRLRHKGIKHKAAGYHVQFKCEDCGKYSNGPLIKVEDKITIK